MKGLPSGSVRCFYSCDSPHLDYEGIGVDFRLTYDGNLFSNGDASHKHEIRKRFHKQLRRLWEVHPMLSVWAGVDNKPAWQEIAEQYHCNGYRYVPLATEHHKLIVSLEILYLRTGHPGGVIRAADIDNRLKTLFDALRMPGPNADELGGYRTPDADEDPFFVLLEDDNLIGNVAVYTDTLLEPTPGMEGRFMNNDARLVINVRLVTNAPVMWSPFR